MSAAGARGRISGSRTAWRGEVPPSKEAVDGVGDEVVPGGPDLLDQQCRARFIAKVSWKQMLENNYYKVFTIENWLNLLCWYSRLQQNWRGAPPCTGPNLQHSGLEQLNCLKVRSQKLRKPKSINHFKKSKTGCNNLLC